MASNFPTSVDSFTSKVDSVDYPKAADVDDLQNAVVTVQTKVGVTGSADTNSLDYKIANMWKTIYPIGCIFESVVSTSPQTLFGGTWVAFGTGRVLVGYDAGQTEFDTVEETGGEKTHVLTETELATHSHGVNDPSHAHPIGSRDQDGDADQMHRSSSMTHITYIYAYTGISIQNTGSSTAHNNLQPYTVAYRWKRTA